MHLRIIIGIFTLFLAQSVYMARSSQKRNAMGSVPFLGGSDSVCLRYWLVFEIHIALEVFMLKKNRKY
jgi:hypothetical protein